MSIRHSELSEVLISRAFPGFIIILSLIHCKWQVAQWLLFINHSQPTGTDTEVGVLRNLTGGCTHHSTSKQKNLSLCPLISSLPVEAYCLNYSHAICISILPTCTGTVCFNYFCWTLPPRYSVLGEGLRSRAPSTVSGRASTEGGRRGGKGCDWERPAMARLTGEGWERRKCLLRFLFRLAFLNALWRSGFLEKETKPGCWELYVLVEMSHCFYCILYNVHIWKKCMYIYI